MENELLQALSDVGYSGPLLDFTRFSQALQGGACSPDYTSLVSWLTDQIGSFGNFDETVHPTSSPKDANSFLIELSSFLRELGCVNQKLTTGNVNQRLATIEERGTLIDYLTAELMTFKILEAKKPDDKNVQITISESITARNMREMLKALRFPKPPDNIGSDLLFKKLHAKVLEIMKQVPKELIGKPLFFGELNSNQWEKLDALQGDLNEEYTIRREMLLTRLDVTVNSFSWSERIRPKEDELNKCYHAKRDAMKREPDVNLAHLLASRDDLAIIEKTSNASVRKNTRSQVNKVIIGAVPDRGGRPCEQEPPPPEMPPWQKDRVQGPPQRGGFGGGGGGGRGGGGRGGGGYGGGGGYRDNKSASTNFGQNFEPNALKNFDTKLSNYTAQTLGYSNPGSGYSKQSSSYGNQSSGYSGPSYGNQSSSYSNQGGYERRSGGGDYNKGGQGGGRGGRVQGGWNQGGDSGSSRGGYNNRNQGQGGGRRY